ncbi:MAG: hypothetical protein K6V97_09400 [Actinomycetia bacterium]|nr:hypothetical protein [Actinomycetes bacterium]
MQAVSAVILVLLAAAVLVWIWRRAGGWSAGPGLGRGPAAWVRPAEAGVRVLQRIPVTPQAVLVYLELPDGRRLVVAVGAPATVVAGDGSMSFDPPRERREGNAPSGGGMH